jgi:tRNA 2-thiouridine synthesizing protein A
MQKSRYLKLQKNYRAHETADPSQTPLGMTNFYVTISAPFPELPQKTQPTSGIFSTRFREQYMNTLNITKELDVKGLNCPLPILRAKKALADMESGQVLRIVATDPGSVKDFAAFCRQTGNPLLGSEETASTFTFTISKR